jgi:hypothetical protein
LNKVKQWSENAFARISTHGNTTTRRKLKILLRVRLVNVVC